MYSSVSSHNHHTHRLSIIVFVLLGDVLEGRWRHSATPINDRLIMIVGGRTENGRVFNDILILDTQDWIIKKVCINYCNY